MGVDGATDKLYSEMIIILHSFPFTLILFEQKHFSIISIIVL